MNIRASFHPTISKTISLASQFASHPGQMEIAPAERSTPHLLLEITQTEVEIFFGHCDTAQFFDGFDLLLAFLLQLGCDLLLAFLLQAFLRGFST